jgi:NAD/NADP transhydrogenase alpha subunit
MVTCGARRKMERKRVRKSIAYLVIIISPCLFPGLKAPRLPREQGRGEHELNIYMMKN